MIVRALLSVGLLCISACTVGPEPVAPALDAPAAFENAFAVSDRPVQEDWYLAFNDPVLTDLVEAALANNLDISGALARLEASRANARAAGASLLPTLDAFVSEQIGGLVTGGVDASSTLSGDLSLAFDPDIAGRNQRLVEAARARVEAAAFSVEDIRRLVVQNVALEYISLRRAGARLTLLDETLELQARTLEIVTARFDAGLSPALDVDRSAADLARSRAQRGLFEAERKRAAYALSVLTGLPPRSDRFMAGNDPIPAFVGDPELGIPADLLRNRPDIRRAEALLVVETALIGVETADLYPSLRLPGTLSGRAGDSTNDIAFSASALLDIPLLDFGRREAEVDAQTASARAALEAYRLSLLEAQQEIESALVEVSALKEQRLELERAGKRSQAAYDQLDALYREGLAGFIDVLDAQRTLIQIRQQIVETDAALATALATLSAALGASFAVADTP